MKIDEERYLEQFWKFCTARMYRMRNRFREKYLAYMKAEEEAVRGFVKGFTFDDDMLPGWADRVIRGDGFRRLSRRTRLFLLTYHNAVLKKRRMLWAKGIDRDPTFEEIPAWSDCFRENAGPAPVVNDIDEDSFDIEIPEIRISKKAKRANKMLMKGKKGK